jgi:hypothetical protein
MDPKRIPSALIPLIPMVEKWGIGDDYDREAAVSKASTAELEALIQSIDETSDEDLYGWLAGPESRDPRPSQEYVAFTNFTMAIDSARVRLKRRGPGGSGAG